MGDLYLIREEQSARLRHLLREHPVAVAPAGAAPARASPLFARVTSATPDGSGHYPAVITLWSGIDGAWEDFGVCKVKPANGEVLSNGTRYGVRSAGVTAGGDDLFVVGASAAGVSITVREVDGSPTGTASIVEFDQATGVTVVSVGGGVARVANQAATQTLWGVVNTTTQTFGGTKTIIADANNPVLKLTTFSTNGTGLTVTGSAGRAVVQVEVSDPISIASQTRTAFRCFAGSGADYGEQGCFSILSARTASSDGTTYSFTARGAILEGSSAGVSIIAHHGLLSATLQIGGGSGSWSFGAADGFAPTLQIIDGVNTYSGGTSTTGGLTFKSGIYVSGSATGASDGNYGDITVSGGGTSWQLNANSVGSPEIADGAVGTSELADSAVSVPKAGGPFKMLAFGGWR